MLDYPATRDTDELGREIVRLVKQLRVTNDLDAELVRNNAQLIELCTTNDLTNLKNSPIDGLSAFGHLPGLLHCFSTREAW